MNLHKMRVWKRKEGPFRGIWQGECKCGYKIQYWSWGAILGAVWLHYWKAQYS